MKSKLVFVTAIALALLAPSLLGQAPGPPPTPAPGGNPHYQAAKAALMAGDRTKAELEAKLALQANSNDAQAHFLLASLLAEKGDYDQAIVGFQRACTLDPTNPEALYNLGTLLLWKKEPVPAAKILESAILILPDQPPFYNNLAKAYFMAGVPELAVANYEQALLLDPWNVIALTNLATLADGAGLKDTAAEYRKHLQAAQASGRTAPPAGKPEEPLLLLPTWPLAAKTVNQPPPRRLAVLPRNRRLSRTLMLKSCGRTSATYLM